METTASSMFRGAAQPAFDQIDHARRIDFDAPLVFGTIGGRQVVLARPDQRRASADEPVDVTVPLTMSRLQRAIDIEHSRAVGLSKKVEELQGAQRQQHDDTVAMRGYLEGYLKSLRENQQTLAEVAPAPEPSLRPMVRSRTSGEPAKPTLKPLPPPTLPKPAERPPMAAPPDFGKL